MSKEKNDFLKKYAANAERLHRVGIHSFAFDPGYLCRVDEVLDSIDLPDKVAEIICDLIKKVYPETQNEKAMISAYKAKTERK